MSATRTETNGNGMLLAPLLSLSDEESSILDSDDSNDTSIRRLTANDKSKRRGTVDTDSLCEENDSINNGANVLCCDDENCDDRLVNANFFLPAGVLPDNSIQSKRNCISCRYCERCSIVHHLNRHVSARARTLPDTTVVVEEEENGEPISTVGRSHITAQGICCASEIPMVQSVLLPIEGVVSFKVSPATKAIYVDHAINIVSATVEITQQIGIPLDITVESVFAIVKTDGKVADLKEKEVSSKLKTSLGEEGIIRVSLDVDGTSLTVEHNPYHVTATQIIHSLQDSIQGYSITINKDGGEDGRWAMKGGESEYIEPKRPKVGLLVILSGVLCAISFLGYIPGENWHYLEWVALGSVALGLPSVTIKAFRTLRRYKFDVNCLILVAVVGACALQDFVEAAVLVFLFDISGKSNNIRIASAVKIGSIVSVKTGDKVPCDGIVIEGDSTVDESNLTGESRPVKKGIGDTVSGGTINNGSTQLIIKTTATSKNSAVAKLLKIVEEAQSNRSTTEAMVDSVAQVYTPIVVLTALCMCTFPFIISKEVGKDWLMRGLILLVAACPCAVIISTPVTYVAGLAACAQKGIIVKGGQHLETLAMIKVIVFDKTGTLSEGVFQLLHFNEIGQSRTRKEILAYLSLMEASASHPLADAIVKGAKNEGATIPKHLQVKNHTLLPGEGVTGSIDGKKVYVGNKRLFDRLGLYQELPTEEASKTNKWAASGGTIGFISIEGEGIVGAYCVSDKIRKETKAVISELKKKGINIKMLTGDLSQSALGVANQIGLDESDVQSECLPEDKLVAIQELFDEHKQQKTCCRAHKVMMMGDGVNDAPALALANVSVAMGDGSALALDTSDITLMGSDLNKLLYIISMGSKVSKRIIENVVFSMLVKIVVVAFTFSGQLHLWAAILSDIGAMLVVTFNGLRLLPTKKQLKETKAECV